MKRNKKKLLVTGISGLLGNNLACYFRNKYEILGIYNSHPVSIKGIKIEKADILSFNSVKIIIDAFKPDILIHCASLTDVDFCEINQKMAERVNITGTKIIVDCIAGTNVKLIYISTDSVYDGQRGDFSETDKINPKNYYGLTKYKGELEVLKKPHSLVLRTNIFGWNIQEKYSLSEWILNQLLNKKAVNGFSDAYFSSIYTFEFARILDRAIKKNLNGIYNCASSTSLSKFEFAMNIAETFNLDVSLIKPISIDNYGFKAKRGKNLTLNISKISKDLNFKLPALERSIGRFYQDYKKGISSRIKLGKRPSNIVKQLRYIPYGKQSIDKEDIKAVVDVLRSDRITQGPKIQEFENALCKYTGAKYAVCVSNGTTALHIACLAAGVKDKDEVITSPITFIASANSILYCGGKPVFADIQKDTINIDSGKIKDKITKKTRVIIPVHFAGHPCDLKEINEIAKKNNLLVIEDAAHALGAEYNKSKIGSCRYSDMTIFSFHPVKSITTGEGGAVLTNNEKYYEKLLLLRNHGITKKTEKFIEEDLAFQSGSNPDSLKPNPWYYEMQELGFNYRITDIQCALGISQLKKIDSFVSRRREIASIYNKELNGLKNLVLPLVSKNKRSSYHLYILRINFNLLKKTRAEIMAEFNKRNIGTQVHYLPVYKQLYYKKLGFTGKGFENAEAYYRKGLSIPIYPSMNNNDVYRVINAIKELIVE